jgi:hypothetical protein
VNRLHLIIIFRHISNNDHTQHTTLVPSLSLLLYTFLSVFHYHFLPLVNEFRELVWIFLYISEFPHKIFHFFAVLKIFWCFAV